jgi:hypothetical protein
MAGRNVNTPVGTYDVDDYPLPSQRIAFIYDRLFEKLVADVNAGRQLGIELFLKVSDHSLKHFGGGAGQQIQLVLPAGLEGIRIEEDVRGCPVNSTDIDSDADDISVPAPAPVKPVRKPVAPKEEVEKPGTLRVADIDFGDQF